MNEALKSVIGDPATDATYLRQMVDHTDAQIAYLDFDFNFIDVNRAYVDGSGKLYDELIGKNHFDIFPNEENFKIFKMVRDSGKPIEFYAKPFIFPGQPERGTTYWDWVLKPVKNEDGQVTGLVLSLKEVSDRFKIWKQSRKSALKLMAYMALTIFAVDFLIMLVFKLLDDIQSVDFLVLDPFILACFLLPIVYFFFLRPLITNLAHTKQTKQTLLESFEKLENERKRLFSILDELPASVHLLRSDHSIAYANRYFKENFGSELKKPCFKILHGQESACKTCHAFEVFDQGQGGQSEELHANGRLYQIYNYPFADIDGSNLVLQLGIDLTKQKEYERRLIQTEKLHMVAEMSAMISHEFRNSLTSVKMILELQSESKTLSSREKNSLAVVLSSINHMEDIVTQLLHFSQPRQKKFGHEDLNAIIEECVDFTKIQLKKNNIFLDKKLNQEIPTLFLDKFYIKEAIVNLILNAVHAISEKNDEQVERRIVISTEMYELAETLKIKANGDLIDIPGDPLTDQWANELVFPEGETCVLLTVRDTGIGIRKSKIGNIFNPFYTDKRQGGTGLGLSVVKRNITVHRGIVIAQSEPGQGAVFKIYLPLV